MLNGVDRRDRDHRALEPRCRGGDEVGVVGALVQPDRRRRLAGAFPRHPRVGVGPLRDVDQLGEIVNLPRIDRDRPRFFLRGFPRQIPLILLQLWWRPWPGGGGGRDLSGETCAASGQLRNKNQQRDRCPSVQFNERFHLSPGFSATCLRLLFSSVIFSCCFHCAVFFRHFPCQPDRNCGCSSQTKRSDLLR